ncbi:hypothetical protein A2881_05575 [Candidatus Peribacteria bacterium RIFCSPHIGHO2_01_FULL_55_13]|nr:MAG: hypothetical protein A2881_05575 [Candidatus Peribacteria bacterium RIFCSPHIGHO2_01_FULL_55_13]OGJ64748.1 MAG: hypothetical protein A3F36_05370 [Candidatus Peribacteria bacterium RIFCSPHIGHO2_12_FULL_55_11]
MLMTSSDVFRLVGSHGMQDLEQILTELRITDEIDQSLRNADAILDALNTWLRTEVEQMVLPEQAKVFRILWLENDVPLVAYLLKKRHGFTSPISREPASALSSFDPEALRAMIGNGEPGKLPGDLVQWVKEMVSKEGALPEQLDTETARFFATMRLKIAKESGSTDIARYVRNTIDSQNVRTALRLLGKEEKDPAMHFLHGGAIPVAHLTGSLETVRAAIEHSPLHFHMLKTLDRLEDGNAVEQGLRGLLAKDLETMWQSILGVEAPFAFAATAVQQFRTLRAVIIGKRNGLSPQEIARILPPFIGSSRFTA